jgi:type I restriction enzyme S subunit
MLNKVSINKLPESWIWTTIGEIGLLSSGGTPDRKYSKYFNGNIPWVKSGELDFKTILDTEEKITQEALENSSAKMVPANSILIALYGATVGKLAILGIDASTNQAVAAINTTKSFNKRFLYYYLLKNRDRLLHQRKGGAQPNISQKILIDFPVPLPPLEEQNRIVSKIEELYSELDHAEDGLKKAQRQLEVYKQSILKSAFEGKLTENWREQNPTITAVEELKIIKDSRKKKYNEDIKKKDTRKPHVDFDFEFSKNSKIKSWAEATLNNLIDINARIGWRGLKKDEYTKEGPLFLSVHSLNFGKNVVFKDAYHISLDRYDESPEIKLEAGDILLCKDGAGIGKVAIIKHLSDKATVNSSLLVIRTKEVFVPDFFYYFLLGPTMQKLVNGKISGSAIPHLFQKDIKKFKLKVPPIEEQKQIVQELESKFTLIEHLSITIDGGLQKISAFRNVILKKAFEGNLVVQGPNDEDAAQLLKYIKSEKESYLLEKNAADKLKPKKTITMSESKTILEILEEANGPILAKEVWQSSIHKEDIDAFYEKLKEHIEKNEIEEVERNGKESFLKLSLQNENR